MDKKVVIPTFDDLILTLKVLAKDKEDVRQKLAVTAKKLALKAKQLAVTAADKESIRRKLEITARDKENVRRKLEITAKDKENVRQKLEITAADKESIRRKLTFTAKKLALKAKQLAVTAADKESIRRKLAVISEKLKKSYETLEKNVFERTKDLEQARAKDIAILSSIADGLIVTDEKGRITFGNSVFEQLLGWSLDEAKGKLLTDLVPMFNDLGDKMTQSERLMTRALTKGQRKPVTGIVYKYSRKDGSVFPVMISVSPVVIAGVAGGAVEVFRDITKEEKIDKAKTEFVSLASHQLRTPLTMIGWYTEMILKGDVGELLPNQKKYLEEIYEGNKRMVDLVNTLLDVSRIELGTFKVEPKPTDIMALAQSVLDEQKPEIEEKKLVIDEDFGKDFPEFLTDPKLLRTIFQNLLNNAVKYTPYGGRIGFSISLDDEKTLHIKVSDTGYGIPNNQKDQIFTKLFRADNVRSKDTTGTGLGLYIIKSIIENSGGKIRFESEENKGTAFYVTLPSASADH